eukprot:618949-Prorocentrum_minimum.AAC.1
MASSTPEVGCVTAPSSPFPTPTAKPCIPPCTAPRMGLDTTPVTPQMSPVASASLPSSRWSFTPAAPCRCSAVRPRRTRKRLSRDSAAAACPMCSSMPAMLSRMAELRRTESTAAVMRYFILRLEISSRNANWSVSGASATFAKNAAPSLRTDQSCVRAGGRKEGDPGRGGLKGTRPRVEATGRIGLPQPTRLN